MSKDDTRTIVEFDTKEKVSDIDEYVYWDVFKSYLLGEVRDLEDDVLKISGDKVRYRDKPQQQNNCRRDAVLSNFLEIRRGCRFLGKTKRKGSIR
ncbi:MAG: hypothetical protein N2Z80_04600 [Hydrogenothermaceae bacterium]|nr:hypothetical protein [Hydrogenothermaceae bacterium]